MFIKTNRTRRCFLNPARRFVHKNKSREEVYSLTTTAPTTIAAAVTTTIADPLGQKRCKGVV